MQYFRHNKFSSFRRQLNLYGYRKVIKGPDAGAYMHPFFQRGRPDLLKDVKKGKVTFARGHPVGIESPLGVDDAFVECLCFSVGPWGVVWALLRH